MVNDFMTFLHDLTFERLNEIFPAIEKYRYKQIVDWIFKERVNTPDKMLNLPKKLREEIASNITLGSPKIINEDVTSDKTRKYLVELYDKEVIEFVIIDSLKRKTLCISSQVGCPVGCFFCASGKYGLTRNLLHSEIIYQFIECSNILKSLPDNLVFMGIGEPLLNFKNLVLALDVICSPQYLNYAARRVTISTSGIPDNIIKLASLKRQWNLAVSLHAVSDDKRAMLIPEHARYPISKILESCKEYMVASNRLITFEYTLIDSINDSEEDAKILGKMANNFPAKINLIPYNSTDNDRFKKPLNKTCLRFVETLKKMGANVTLRIEKGSKISAACGQLRAYHLNQ